MNPNLQYKKALASHLSVDPSQITLSWKGRVGLYGILKAIDIKEGDEVILPAFTCVVVSNAIIYLGAKPIYVDIDPQTYNIDISLIESKINSKTVAVIAQNTFGLSSDFDAINSICEKHKIHVIEDCTHGFGGRYKNKPNGTLAKAAFYSSQWNKTFSTGIGGMTICNDPLLAKRLNAFEAELEVPGVTEKNALWAQLFVKNKILTKSLYWTALKLYRYLAKNNVITGSSQGLELEKPEMPKGFLKGMSTVQAKEGTRQMKLLDKNIKHRRQIAEIYHEALKTINITPPYEPVYGFHTFIKYAILVKDRTKFLALGEKYKIQLGDWFISPIHPIEKKFDLWLYNYGQFPVAEKISKHILNLPTDMSISIKEAHRIADFVKNHAAEFLSFQTT